MKIVKFKNGKYGVRRFDLFFLSFEFLGKNSEYWFSFQEHVAKHCYFDSVADCKYAIKALKEIKKRKKKDIGKAI